MHKGHLDILSRAEQIFDKVIIACGVNPEKKSVETTLTRNNYFTDLAEKILPYHQVVRFDNILHEFVRGLGYPVTIIKGLRNPSDFDSEKLQFRYMEDFNPDIKIVYMMSSREFDHISSSAIKSIKAFGGDYTKKYEL